MNTKLKNQTKGGGPGRAAGAVVERHTGRPAAGLLAAAAGLSAAQQRTAVRCLPVVRSDLPF